MDLFIKRKHTSILVLKQLLFFLLFSMLTLTLIGQSSKTLDFKVFGFEDGLSHRNCFGVSQDSTGFIWIGTINGLNRFDGEHFNIYSSSTGDVRLPQNFITDLTFEDPNQMWISHRTGISKFDLERNSLTVFEAEKDSPLPEGDWDAGHLTLISESRNEVAAFAVNSKTGEKFLIKTAESKELKVLLKLTGSLGETPLAFWKEGLIFEESPGRLSYVSPEGKRLKMFILQGVTQTNPVVDFFIKKDGQLVVLTADGKLFYSEGGDFVQGVGLEGLTSKSNANLETLFIEEGGDIWIGGYSELWYFDKHFKKWSNHHSDVYQLVKNTCQFRDVFQDKLGILWAASDFGLVKITRNQKRFANYLADGNEHCNNGFCSTRGITEDEEGNIYFSMYNTIQVLNAKTNEVRPLFGKKDFHNPPFGILHHNGYLWTGNGLRINLQTQKISEVLDIPRNDEGVVVKDASETVWLGFQNKIYRFPKNGNRFSEFDDPTGIFHIKENNISYLLPSSDGNNLWVATNNNGIYKINTSTGTELHINADTLSIPRLPANRIIGMQEDSKGNLWVATAAGVARLDADNELLTTYRESEGLPNDFINGILLEGDTAVWISTDNGLSRMSFGQQSFQNRNLKVTNHRFYNFFQQDGISANEFNRVSFFKSSTGRMFFGGLNGVNAFYPSDEMYKAPEYPTVQLVLTGFSKYNPGNDSTEVNIKPEDALGGVLLGPRDRFFKFSFSLLDFNRPDKNQYSYILEGNESDWSPPITNNEIQFSDIPPGSYTFKLKARAGSNKWSEQLIEIPVFIQKPFWKTTWFMLLCGGLLFGAFFGYIQWQNYTARKRQEVLEREVQIRTRELEDEKKKSDDLLLNILPEETAYELRHFGEAKAKRHDNAIVLFSDFKGFSKIAEGLEPEELVSEIDLCFRAFDQIIEKYGLEKIKTIGDAYMCAGGLKNDNSKEEVCNVIRAGLEMQQAIKDLKTAKEARGESFFETRIGIHNGPVVAGVVGVKKFAYDIWGETVNLASRMESYGDVGQVNISEFTYEVVKHHFSCKPQATFVAKSGTEVQMYFVEGEI